MTDLEREPHTAPPEISDFEGRRAYGRAARVRTPRSSHAEWSPPKDRTDPVSLLEEQTQSRVPELVPVRYGRMMVSPFTFYRGAALLMASDLSLTPSSELEVQLCGDAHLSNFGLFGTPERRLVFDINDFDEALPGPFEWDLKRLVASFEIAGRHRGFSDEVRRGLLTAATSGYRERMVRAADEPVLNAWYNHLDADQVEVWLSEERQLNRAKKTEMKSFEAIVSKARTKDSLRAFEKLTTIEDGQLRIISAPPLIVRVEDVIAAARDGYPLEDAESAMRGILAGYQKTLLTERHPVAEYTYVHMARKVVGVGSVGTRAWIVLMQGRDAADPLLLQAKEAQTSVLARFLPPSKYDNQGERVVRGQRMMQASSDIFLGWQRVAGEGGVERDYYVRQLHDWKGSIDPEVMTTRGATLYARICGETLARAHARTGDRVAIAAYLGKSDAFDLAISDFAEKYADQNEADFQEFIAAIESGRLVAESGL